MVIDADSILRMPFYPEHFNVTRGAAPPLASCLYTSFLMVYTADIVLHLLTWVLHRGSGCMHVINMTCRVSRVSMGNYSEFRSSNISR